MAISTSIKRFWALTALVVLVQLLVVQAMAASGAVHKCLHDHAGDQGHECAVNLTLEGGYDTVAPEVILENLVADRPSAPNPVSDSADFTPGHLVGGVLAQAPPRGP